MRTVLIEMSNDARQPTRQKHVRSRFADSLLAATILIAALGTACGPFPTASGSFEQTSSVTGPVRVELQNGSGSVHISSGPAGQVRIHGEFQLRDWPWENVRQRAEYLSKNPPIEQRGNLIRIGREAFTLERTTVNYTIVVPSETELQGFTGSGSLDLTGIRGPAKLTTGSGRITADNIDDDTDVTAGSGSIHLANIRGEARLTAGSGRITVENIRGHIRATCGSGGITIERPGGSIRASTGSGRIQVKGASADLRLSSGSGGLTVEGSPAPTSFWELHTGSGSIALDVPANASFRFYAHSRSGQIETEIPVVVEERTRHELRARVGQGQARVEVESSSGTIRVR